jgi:membrane protein insertase Oxa1/YidC/SpoIIIJ
MSTEMISKVFQTIQTHLMNDEWVKSQQEELVDALSMACVCQVLMFRVTARYEQDQHKLSLA